MAMVQVTQSSSQKQVVQTQQYQRKPGGGGGDDGGRRDPGRDIPEFPEDENLYAYLVFVHDLLEYWQRQVQSKEREFDDFDDADRVELQSGWSSFHAQWADSQKQLRAAVEELDADEQRRRGLNDDAYRMKRHFIRKWRNRLQEAREAFADQMTLRGLWRKLFTSADVVLDSAERALNVIPVAGAIVSGLKEFKETAMGVTEDR